MIKTGKDSLAPAALQENAGIDVGKFCASLLVLVIHVIPSPPQTESAAIVLLQILARSAVPFFFVCSAFFLFSKPVTPKRLGSYVKRILILYAFWFIVLLPVTLYFRIWLFRDRLTWALLNQVKAFFITSTFPGSWYLMGSVFSAALIWLLSQKFTTKSILLLTAGTELFCIAATLYGAPLQRLPWYQALLQATAEPQVSIIAAPFYFALGKLCAEEREKFSCPPLYTWILGAALSYAGMAAEYFVAVKIGAFYTLNRSFFLIPFTLLRF